MLMVSWDGCCRRSKHDGDEAEENLRGGHGALTLSSAALVVVGRLPRAAASHGT
jgi:hypothetical protein